MSLYCTVVTCMFRYLMFSDLISVAIGRVFVQRYSLLLSEQEVEDRAAEGVTVNNARECKHGKHNKLAPSSSRLSK